MFHTKADVRRWLNLFLNGFAVTFAVPSFLIIISWNTIPGDRLYGVKTGLEKIALNATIKTPLASILSVKYTQRRFSEANTLLSKKGSTLGYQLLVTETKSSGAIIKSKKDRARSRELISKINEYQKQITLKKTAIETGNLDIPIADSAISPASSVSTTPPTQKPTPTPKTDTKPDLPIPSDSPTTTPVPEPIPETSEEILEKLEETNKELEKVKKDLTTNVGASKTNPVQTPNSNINLPTLPQLSPENQPSEEPIIVVTPSPQIPLNQPETSVAP